MGDVINVNSPLSHEINHAANKLADIYDPLMQDNWGGPHPEKPQAKLNEKYAEIIADNDNTIGKLQSEGVKYPANSQEIMARHEQEFRERYPNGPVDASGNKITGPAEIALLKANLDMERAERLANDPSKSSETMLALYEAQTHMRESSAGIQTEIDQAKAYYASQAQSSVQQQGTTLNVPPQSDPSAVVYSQPAPVIVVSPEPDYLIAARQHGAQINVHINIGGNGGSPQHAPDHHLASPQPTVQHQNGGGHRR